MKIFFGYNEYELKKNNKEVPIVWNSDMVATRHMLIMGQSGSGKTYTLKNIINQMKKQDENIRIHVFDFHGDIDIAGCSSVKFSATTEFGFNPLIVNDDLDFGGVRNKIQSFISLINSSGRGLGPKQEAVLRNILLDLYAANGFYPSKPESWKLDDGVPRKFPKKHPTLSDALKFSNFKLQSLMLGSNNKAMSLLEQLNKSATKLYSRLKSVNKESPSAEMTEMGNKLAEAKEQCIEEYTKYINSIQKGTELHDLMKYDSKDVLKSVVERLENLYNCGIFKDKLPPFDNHNNVWRYDIKALRLEEKKMFVNMLLEQIFERRKQAGVEAQLKEIVVVDESHIYFNDDPENIINMIAKEARKFGMGLICASQSPEHFSDDFLTNVGCNIITGIHEKFWAGSSKKLNINPKSFAYITMQKNMLVQVKNKGISGSLFTLTCFNK